ncbi:PAS domain S-box protein [Roseomonas sp. CCTCC AB2023176]|uniref:PAS domain S-box protein n=1 Tax=Roseomonas sp. CCTCC AB2023176 TaxID=3342640 RepID=UPI0035D940EE
MPDVERMVRRQRALAGFGEFALRSDNLDEILTEACRLVGEALETNHAKILEIQDDGRSLLVRAGVGWSSDVVGRVRLEMTERSSETFSIASGKPVITRDIREEVRFELPAFLQEAGVIALANVPIFLPGGKPYGLLQVDHNEPRDFGPEDSEFLRTYATILGPVIDRLHQVHRLRTTEERFRLIVEAARDYAIFVTDAEARITDWFPGAEAVFGWTAAEAVGQPTGFLFTPEDRESGAYDGEFETARVEGVAANVRWHPRKDGSRVFIEGSNRVLRGTDGELHGFFKIGQDVTERRRVEEQLRESEGRHRALVEALPQLIWRSAARGEWNWGGPQWTAYTGLSIEASRGQGWLEALHPEDRQTARDAWARTEEIGLFQADYRIRHAGSGRYVWFQTRAVPVRDEGGRIIEWVGASTDIEDQVRAREVLARGSEELGALVTKRTAELMAAEESLRQAQKMEAVGQLTGGIAHDFNNMLQGVAGGIDMARRRIAEGRGGEVGRYLDASREAVGRAAGLTRRLLAFARRQRLEPRPVNADGLVAGLADLIRRTVGPGIELQLRLHDGVGSVLCDANELESALLNLCINARDAMPGGGRLTVSTEAVQLSADDLQRIEDPPPGDYVTIRVADTGAGMPPEVLERVFDPFFTTKAQGQGTGLGLSQVYGFVRQSGGLVRIESTPGQGTTVCLLMPLHDRAEEAEVRDAPPPPRAVARATVLLVDDEEAVRGPVADRLRDLGYAVIEARDGPEALRTLTSSDPDLLVTDVGLPNGMNGRQVAEAVREGRPGLPVLFVTGYAAASLPPGFEVIGKPFDLDDLARRVQAILGPGRSSGDTNPGA